MRWPYRENDRAHAEGEARGHIKVVISRRGRILGVTIVGAGAGASGVIQVSSRFHSG